MPFSGTTFSVINSFVGGTTISSSQVNQNYSDIATGLTALAAGTQYLAQIELGHATDTTLARVSAGKVSIEGGAGSLYLATIDLGNASDTTLSRSAAGQIAVEGKALRGYLLTSGTVSSAATLDIVLTSYTGYRGFELMISGFRPSTDGVSLSMRFSSDGGSTYDSTGYTYAMLYNVNTGTASGEGANNTTSIFLNPPNGATQLIGSASTEGWNGTISLLNLSSTAFWSRLTFDGFYISNQTSPDGIFVTGGGARKAAQDTDAIRLLFSSGNIAAGNYALYGIP